MTLHAKPPPGDNRDGGSGISISSDNSGNNPPKTKPQAEILRDPRAVRESKRLLKLEFLHEQASSIQIHAALVQTFAEIGDRAGVCYAFRQLFAHAKAAHPIYLELRDEAAPNDGAAS
jgi:hypothetical protein